MPEAALVPSTTGSDIVPVYSADLETSPHDGRLSACSLDNASALPRIGPETYRAPQLLSQATHIDREAWELIKAQLWDAGQKLCGCLQADSGACWQHS